MDEQLNLNTNGGGASTTTEPAAGSSSGTDVDLRTYFLALRRSDEQFHNERDLRYHELSQERDRRYSEVNVEKEKALKIKETADLTALELARQIQDYKDEKGNELRKQIESERGLYTTKDEHSVLMKEVTNQFKPLQDYVITQQGKGSAEDQRGIVHRAYTGLYIAAAGVSITLVALIVTLIATV